MKILIVTPLYPPDIAPLAIYVKECAKRMREKAEISILAYTHLPEKIEGVPIVSISKNAPLPVRLFSFTIALLKEARKADVLYVQNGVSVELPVSLISFLISKPYILHVRDIVALSSSSTHPLLTQILHLALKRVRRIIHDERVQLPYTYPNKTSFITEPTERPEILPLREYPENAVAEYEKSWTEHIEKVIHECTHAK